MEDKGSHLILRHVRDPTRRRKAEDVLVGRTLNDLEAAKVLIGNFAAGAKMTTIRWELYADFPLQTQLASGRFDYGDLLGGLTPDHAKFLAANNVRPSGDWDFDAILLTHRCGLCHRVYDTKSVIYDPRLPCESCGVMPTQDAATQVIEALLLGYRLRFDRFSILNSQGDETCLQYFLDPIPNTIVCWLLTTKYTVEKTTGNDSFPNLQPWLDLAKQRSVFGFTVSDFLRDHLVQVLASSGQDWSVMVHAWQQIGRAFQRDCRCTDNAAINPALLHDHVRVLVSDHFPNLVNQIILEHGLQPLSRKDI